jgi:hypothetical protein
MPRGMMVDLPQQKQGGGMFGGGGIGRVIAGMIGDYLLQMNGMKPVYTPMMQKRQEMQFEEQQYQRQRQDSREDFLWKKEHSPPAPHYFEDNTGNLMAIGPDGQPQTVYQDPNPWKLVPNGMGGVIPVNMQELMGGGTAPKPVGKITPLGGPTPPASGGFPGY